MGCKMAKGKKTKLNSMPKTGDETGIIELNEVQLQDLNRKELQTYCKKYGIKANAKNAELREKLLQLIRSQQEKKTEANNNQIRDESSTAINRSTIPSSIEANSTKLSADTPKSNRKLEVKVPLRIKLDEFKTTLKDQSQDGKSVPVSKNSETTIKQPSEKKTIQDSGDVDSVYGEMIKDNNFKNDKNAQIKAHEDNDDDDSVYNEIISDDALNNTFGLDKSFDVQTSDLTPCLRRQKNATFVVQRATSEKEIYICDSTSTTDDDPVNVAKTVCSRWCVVDGTVKNDREASWKLIKLKGGRPVVPNRFGKYIQFLLGPSQRDVPADFRDNYICGACATRNEEAVTRGDIQNNAAISFASQTISGVFLKGKTSITPKTSFVRNTEIRASIKRKRGDDGERHSREEREETHRKKRHKKSSLLLNKNPASPTVRKARGEAIELPKNHKNPWRPKVPSRSNTPVDVTENALYAEKVEAIIQNTIPGSEEELRLMMSRDCLVQRSPDKNIL